MPTPINHTGFVSNQDPRVQPGYVQPSPQGAGSLNGTMTTPSAPVPPAPTPTAPGSNTAFMSAMQEMETKFKFNNSLMTQRNLLLKHMYNEPLTPEEMSQLDPSMLDAVNSGDRDRVDMNLRLISDEVQGRNNTLDKSFEFLVNSYTKEQDKIEKQRQDAISNVLSFAQVYGSSAKSALTSLYGKDYVDSLKSQGIDLDQFSSVKTTAQLEKEKSGRGTGYGGVLDSLPTSVQTKLLSIAEGFGSTDIVKKYNATVDGINLVNGIDVNTKNPSDHQTIVYAFAKSLDPESVVREGEYATIKKYAQSLTDKYSKELNNAIAGTGFLSQAAIKNIKETMNNNYQSRKPAYDNLYKQKSGVINSVAGQDVADQIMIDYTGGIGGQTDNVQTDLQETIIANKGQNREELIKRLVAVFPELTLDEIAKQVYSLIPDQK